MSLVITPSNEANTYTEIRGNLAENACVLSWQAFKVYKLDDITIAIAGYLASAIGVDVYPREKQLTYPALIAVKLRSDNYTVKGKDDKGGWIDVKRDPSFIEKCLAKEIATNWEQWEGKTLEGQMTFNDINTNPSATPIGMMNKYWQIEVSTYGKCPDWMPPEKKEYGQGFTKFAPKKTSSEVYEEAKNIIKAELSNDDGIILAYRQLKEKYGNDDASDFLNTLMYGILVK